MVNGLVCCDVSSYVFDCEAMVMCIVVVGLRTGVRENYAEQIIKLLVYRIRGRCVLKWIALIVVIEGVRFFFFKQKTAYDMLIGDWSSDVCSSDLIIGAWNFPLNMFLGKIAPVIAAGNCVVYKPADATPVTTLEIAAIISEVLPPGVVNVVTGTGAVTGEAMLAHPAIRIDRKSVV